MGGKKVRRVKIITISREISWERWSTNNNLEIGFIYVGNDA
jgi:hypothetical protein